MRTGQAQRVTYYLTGSGLTGVMRKPGHNTILVPGYSLFVEGKTPHRKVTAGQRLTLLHQTYPAAVPVLVRAFHDDIEEALCVLTLGNFTHLIGGQR